MLCALAVFSAVWIMAFLAYGSLLKLSITQFSASAVPPGALGAGYTTWGPLEQRSKVTPSTHSVRPASISWAEPTITRAPVAQACEYMGPVMPGAPIRPASQGAP